MEKPTVKLSGTDESVWWVVGKVSNALKKAGQEEKAIEFRERAHSSEYISEIVNLIPEYVEVT